MTCSENEASIGSEQPHSPKQGNLNSSYDTTKTNPQGDKDICIRNNGDFKNKGEK